MKILEEKEKQLEIIADKRKVTNGQYQKLNTKMYKEIKVIEDKYAKDLNDFKKEIDANDDQVREIKKEIVQLTIDAEWQEATGRGEINEFYLASMLKKCGCDNYEFNNYIDIKYKQKLQNGLDIWVIANTSHGSPYKFYLAFFECGLVGVSYRETPKHAGDGTDPFSFIGQFEQYLIVSEIIENRKYEVNATFQKWIKALKKLDKDTFDVMPMNEETLKEINKGLHEYWSYYGWQSKEK